MTRPAITTLTERQKEILKLWNLGKSGPAIAAKLHITRNSVMGVLSRLRVRGFVDYRLKPLPREHKTIFRKRPEKKLPPPPPAKPAPTDILGKSVNEFMIKAVTPPKKAGKSVTFAQLRRGMCKYPTSGDKASEYLFCGEPAIPTMSYCVKHMQVCVHSVYNPKDKKNEFWRKKNKF